MFTNKKDSSLILLNIFVLLSIIALTFLTLIEYIDIYSLFKEVDQHIKNIPWPNNFRAMLSSIKSYSDFNYMVKNNLFDDLSLYSEEHY